VIASKTDSYYKIAKQTGIKLSQLYHYNESFTEKDMLNEGDIIYLDPRRIKSKHKKSIVLTQSMSARVLAQREALKLKPLMRRNNISSADEQLPCGREVFLR
jgi:chaperone required for assembly of F1-ATPase